MTKEITSTQLATKMSQVKKWLEYGYELIVIDKNRNEPFAILKPFKEIKREQAETIDLSTQYEDYIIPLTKEEITNPYDLSQQAPEGYNQEPVFRFRN